MSVKSVFQGHQVNGNVRMITMIKMGGCSLPLGRDCSEASSPFTSNEAGWSRLPVSRPTLSVGLEGSDLPSACLVGSVGEMSGDHDPSGGTRSSSLASEEDS